MIKESMNSWVRSNADIKKGLHEKQFTEFIGFYLSSSVEIAIKILSGNHD
jgi:hypothetical protein